MKWAAVKKRIDKQHAQGKMTARERLNKLFDEGSFTEISQFIRHRCTNFNMQEKDIPGDGVVTGYGTVNGRLVFAYAEDFHRRRRLPRRNACS